MPNYWRQLPRVKYARECLVCKRLIKVGQPAWWLKGHGIEHPSCGSPSGFVIVPPPDYDRNPFENINKHLPVFYDAKEFRESQK